MRSDPAWRNRTDESGFTLIELLVAMIILTIIIGPLTAAVILGFETQGSVAARLTTSQGRYSLSVYLPRDAMNGTAAFANNPPGTVTFGQTCAGQTAAITGSLTSPSAVIVVTWTAQQATTDAQGHVTLTPKNYEIDYVQATEPGHPAGQPLLTGLWLWRYAFTPATAYSGSGAASTCGTPLSSTLLTRDLSTVSSSTTSGSGGLQSLSISYTDTSTNSYTISGSTRA